MRYVNSRRAIVCIGIAAAASATSANATDADRAAILAGENHMCGPRATMSQTIDTTIQYYAKDTIQFDVMPKPLHGQEAVRESLAKQYGGTRNMSCSIEDLHVGVEGNLGYAFSIQHYEAEGVEGGPYQNAQLFENGKKAAAPVKVRMSWRQTDIWQKRDGKWAMIHQHSSFPIVLATGKPLMDMPVGGTKD